MRLRLAVAALLLPVLAACGSETATPPPAARSAAPSVAPTPVAKPIDIVRVAGKKTAAAGSARIAVTAEAPGVVSMTGAGVFSLTEPLGSLKMTMRVQGEKVDIEMRVLGDLLYMKMPVIPSDKPWLRFDTEELAGDDLAALSQMQHSDPTQGLAYFEGVSEDVREVGKEDVRGVATTRYSGTLDLNKARAAQPDPRVRKALAAAFRQLGSVRRIPMEVWIDAEGRMRKMTQRLDMAKATGGQASGTMRNTVEMYDFGVPVDVVAPAADRVTDGAAVVRQMQQQLQQQQ